MAIVERNLKINRQLRIRTDLFINKIIINGALVLTQEISNICELAYEW